jgi:hypothetical protein
VTDPNNDLIGGRAEVRNGNVVSTPLNGGTLRGDQFAGVLTTNPLPPGPRPGFFSVFDAAGHESNEISFNLTIQPEASRGAPEIPRGTTPHTFDRLAPAR